MTDEIRVAYDAVAKKGYRGSFALFCDAWLAATENAAMVCDRQAKIYLDVAGSDLCTAAGKALHRSMAAGAENCASTLRERIGDADDCFDANERLELPTYLVTAVSVDFSRGTPVLGVPRTETIDPRTNPRFAVCKSLRDVEFVYESFWNYPDSGEDPANSTDRIKVLFVTFGEKKAAS